MTFIISIYSCFFLPLLCFSVLLCYSLPFSLFCSLGAEFAPLVAFAPAEEGSPPPVREESVVKTVKDMLDIDPFENEVSLLWFVPILLFFVSFA